MHQLHDYLLQRHMENRQVVLFVEEAQGMPLETLEEVRLLSNLETDEHKLLQIILFGQPELDENLSRQSIRQLRERITHNFELEPLTVDEIHNYLNFRMREVGYTGPELINRGLAKRIEQYSGGLLRRINIIADKILLSAFAEGTHNLTAKHVSAAVNDSAFDGEAQRVPRLAWWLGLPLLLLALAFGLYQTRSLWSAQQAAGERPEAPVVAPAESPAETRSGETAEPSSGAMGQVQLASADGLSRETMSIEHLPADAGPVAGLSFANDTDSTARPGTVSGTDAESPTETEARPEGVAAIVQPVEESPPNGAETGVEAQPVKVPETIRRALDQASSSNALEASTGTDLSMPLDDNQWLLDKLEASKAWLSQANRDGVSIQVLMRSKSAARELVYYLRNEWPLELSKTYLYEVQTEDRSIYRVFYSEFDSLSSGRDQLEKLPESVKINSPYLHSVSRMQKALL